MRAAGILLVTPGKRALFLKRSPGSSSAGAWDLPGGRSEGDEDPLTTAIRETREESGWIKPEDNDQDFEVVSEHSNGYTTFKFEVGNEFIPTLDDEHTGWCWASLSDLPQPLISGLEEVMAQDSDWGVTETRMSYPDELVFQAIANALSQKHGEDGVRVSKVPKDTPRVEKISAKPIRHTVVEGTLEEGAHDDMPTLSTQPNSALPAMGKIKKPFLGQDDDPLDWGADLDDLLVDSDHDGLWMSCMSKDGRTMYRNRNLPGSVEIDGQTYPVDDILKHHEGPEWARLQQLVREHGAEPTDEERKDLYLQAHNEEGTPNEREFVEKSLGLDWDKWSAWCRGEESKIEKLTPENEPADADVKPMPHNHGELEETLAEPAQDSAWIAMDKSVRFYDSEGRLKVAITNISKATVNPYVGKEIPNWEQLGLDPNKIYNLLRDPNELSNPETVASFNGIQLLIDHIPVNADDPQKQVIVGCTGTDAVYDHPYLKNSLVVWDREGIDAVESEQKKELSSAYRYIPDMTSGIYEGQRYDGVMRSIRGNHVALVVEGRAGPDCYVADSLNEMKWHILMEALKGFIRAA